MILALDQSAAIVLAAAVPAIGTVLAGALAYYARKDAGKAEGSQRATETAISGLHTLSGSLQQEIGRLQARIDQCDEDRKADRAEIARLEDIIDKQGDRIRELEQAA